MTVKVDAQKLKPYQMLKLARLLLYLVYFLSKIPRVATVLLYLLRPLYEPIRENFLNRKLRYGLLTVGGGLISPDVLKAYGYGARAVIDNINDVLKSVKKGEPVVWVEWILNAEMLEAFNVTSFNNAVLNVFGNAYGASGPWSLIEEAENFGVPIEWCSAMKLNVGAYLRGQIPKPAMTIAGSHPCDTNVSVVPIFEYLMNVPTFIFDVPYWKDDFSYEYSEKQVWKQIEFLEKQLGRKIDWDKFEDMMHRLNGINRYLMEICEMHRATPCPGTLININFAWIVRELNVRSPYTLKMAEALYKAVYKNYVKGKGVVKNEKIRVLLWFPPIAFFTYLFKWMEHEFGAVIVADFIGHVSTLEVDTSSKETMVRDFAKTQMHQAMGRQCHGPVEFITDEMQAAMEAYNVDCMIFSGHNGCKHGWAALKIIQDICNKRKLPVLYLNVDIMDQRHLDETGVRNEITQFFRSHGWV